MSAVTMRVNMDGHPHDAAYEIVGNQMAALLQHVLDGGLTVSSAPEVTEDYSLLTDMTTMTATVVVTQP